MPTTDSVTTGLTMGQLGHRQTSTAEPSPEGQQRRISWLQAVFTALATILILRLAWWQLLPHAEAQLKFEANQIPAARGSILDATGHYLVASTAEFTIGVSPNLLSKNQKAELVPLLATILNLPELSVLEAFSSTRPYVALHPAASMEAAQQVANLDAASAFKQTVRFRRVYPNGTLAASVLGFISLNKGEAQYGLEQYYDKELEGVEGHWYGVYSVLMDPSGYLPAADGADLVLTLDRNIQHQAEISLAEGISQTTATAGNIVVLDPRTGAILAMANLPTYRPGRYWEDVTPNDLSPFTNSSITTAYEPGSVLKPLTLAAALEERVIDLSFTYDDTGQYDLGPGSRPIRNWDRRAHGRTTLTQLLAYSLNVGAARVSEKLGPTRFYELMRRFGFSEFTGVDLALESPGTMRMPGNPYWSMADLATNSFGQGMTATPLQVVAAYGAIANGGLLMKPHIVAEVRDGQTVRVQQPTVVRRVISPQTSQQVTQLMIDALEAGLKKVTLPGYRLAGKSGTAGIPDISGYENKDVVASFVGFGPVPDPRFVILVKYEKPREGYWGGDVAAPAFRELAKYLLDYYGIAPNQ